MTLNYPVTYVDLVALKTISSTFNKTIFYSNCQTFFLTSLAWENHLVMAAKRLGQYFFAS